MTDMNLVFILKKIIFNIVNMVLSLFDYKVIKKFRYFEINLENFKKKNQKIKTENYINFILENKNMSKSQIFQDLLVDFILKKKTNGFYCEVGAADGINLSNTFFLEKERRWKGILCEPSLFWKERLLANRNENILIFDAISDKNEIVTFYEKENNFLSGLKKGLNYSNIYDVKTISLNSVFSNFKIIELDYLSIDTEGNELAVLNGLDLDKFRPKIITIEHNYVNEKQIFKRLSKYNYELVFPYLSRFDSFYVCKEVLKKNYL